MDARVHLSSLVGKEIRTVTGRPNTIIAIQGSDALVATGRTPKGNPVPIAWVQSALDVLERDGEITVDVPTLGYRSAFVGAVLLTVSGAMLVSSSPPRVRRSTGM